MKHKLFLVLTALGLLLPQVASAYDFEVDGIYYNISGSNAEVTYETWSYDSYSGYVVIPSTVTYEGTTYSVTSIGYFAFYACSGLTSVTIPSSVTSIGYEAFGSCTGLTSVTIPSSVTGIGYEAFRSCTGLTSVTIPSSVTGIGYEAFRSCTGLTSISVEEGNSHYDSRNDCNAIIETLSNTLIQGCKNTIIPDGVTSIGDDAFSGCDGLTSVTIPSSVTSIGGGAFNDCTSLISVTIDNGVESIGERAFYGCSGLTSVTIPSSVTSIGDGAFYDCSGLTSVTIDNGVESIGDDAFYDCSGLNSVTIPSSVTSIGSLAFYKCSGLTSITVESGNTQYDSRDNCNAIIETARNELIAGCKNTTIPNSVTSIGNNAFYCCTGLEFIVIPASVTSIDTNAFDGCTSLTLFAVNKSNTAYSSDGGVLMDYNKTTVIRCPQGKTGSFTIPSSVTSIGDCAFGACSGLTSVTIPDGVTSIGRYAFAYCSGLTSVTIPGSVESIEDFAFYNSDGLTSVTILDGVKSIGYFAFYDCSGLTSVTIGSSVTSIGNYAFYYCSGLTSITIPSSVTSIGNYAFDRCSGLTSVTNLATVPQTISSSTFSKYGTLHVRKGYKDVYAAKNYWKNFTIVDDIVYSTTLTDGEEYVSATATDYDEVTYTRTFNNTEWQALYVPFSLDYDEWKEDFDVAEISTYAQYDDNTDGEYDRMYLVVEKKEVGSTLANHPYLIRAKSTGTKTLALTNKTLKAAEVNSMTCTSALGNYELTITGTYTEKTDMFANGYYALSGGRLMQANSASVVLKPQRWYLDAKALGSGVKAWKIVVEETEGIKAPSSSPKGESPVAYDLMGRGVKGAVRGISIVNGKKIIN